MNEHIRIAIDECKGCLLCIPACPNGLLITGNQPNRHGHHPVQLIDADYCTDCLRCVSICPDQALIPPAQPHFNLAGYLYGWSRRRELKALNKNV